MTAPETLHNLKDQKTALQFITEYLERRRKGLQENGKGEYRIKRNDIENLPKTDPRTQITRIYYVIESPDEVIEETRVIKQYLIDQEHLISKRFATKKEAASFEKKLLEHYHQFAPELVPAVVDGEEGIKEGILLMEDAGRVSFGDRWWDIRNRTSGPSNFEALLDDALDAIDRLHHIAGAHKDIREIVDKSYSLPFHEKPRISYRLLLAPSQRARGKVEGEDAFSKAFDVLFSYLPSEKHQVIHGDMNDSHLHTRENENKFRVIDFGRSRRGPVQYDTAGLVFSTNLPFEVRDAVSHYKDRYHCDEQEVIGLCGCGVLKAISAAAYLNKLETLYGYEYKNLREQHSYYAERARYLSKINDLFDILVAYDPLFRPLQSFCEEVLLDSELQIKINGSKKRRA